MHANIRTTAPWAPAGGTDTAWEIAQQPALWAALADALEADRARIEAFLGEWLKQPTHRVLLTGAGSSGFIADMAAERIAAQWPAQVRAVHTTSLLTHPVLYLQRDRPTLLVSFGRSGSSPESVAAVDVVRAHVHQTRFIDITCNADGELAVRGRGREDTLALLMPEASCDRAFAMTSSLTCMLLTALTVFDDAPWKRRIARLHALSALGTRALEDWDADVERIAATPHQRVIVLGSGPLEPLAKECALKVLELTAGRVVALANTPLGFRHGPKALLDGDTLVLVLRSVEPLARRYEQDLLDELRRDGIAGQVITVGPAIGAAGEGDLTLDISSHERMLDHGMLDDSMLDNSMLDDSMLSPIWLTVAQRYALRRSAAMGYTPDNPFPDGTVNRVVQGVTIHRDAQG